MNYWWTIRDAPKPPDKVNGYYGQGFDMTVNNPGRPYDEMGIIKDTENVRAVEEIYKVDLVGYSAWWDDNFRAKVWDSKINQWRGVYPLREDDFQKKR
jgi:hypothetical protein